MDVNKCDRTAVSKLTFEFDKCLPAGHILKIHSDSHCSNPEQNNAILDNAIVKKYHFKSQEIVSCLPKYHALLKVLKSSKYLQNNPSRTNSNQLAKKLVALGFRRIELVEFF